MTAPSPDLQLSPDFTLRELTATQVNLPNVPDAREIERLRALALRILQPPRDAVGVPVHVSSGFRSAAVNQAVGGARSSQHRLGEAADIHGVGITSLSLSRRVVALDLLFDQLIDEFGRWVHLSQGPRHRRQILTAVIRDGRTVYLPGLGHT